MNSSCYVLQGICNGCWVNIPWRAMNMNTNGQVIRTEFSSTMIKQTVEAARVTPSTPLNVRDYERLDHPPESKDNQWKPVLAQCCGNPNFESVHALCDDEILFSQGDREYS